MCGQEWVRPQLLEAVTTMTRSEQNARAAGGNPVLAFFESQRFTRRLCDEHGVGFAAMPMRLRRVDQTAAAPSLPIVCNLCEAGFSRWYRFRWHQQLAHGRRQRYRNAWLELEYEKPHVVTAYEKRRVAENFHRSYRTATMPGGEEDDD